MNSAHRWMAVKAALMFYFIYSFKEDPLITMGDAVASLLDEEDETTHDLSLFSVRKGTIGHSADVRPWEDVICEWEGSTSKRRRKIIVSM